MEWKEIGAVVVIIIANFGIAKFLVSWLKQELKDDLTKLDKRIDELREDIKEVRSKDVRACLKSRNPSSEETILE